MAAQLWAGRGGMKRDLHVLAGAIKPVSIVAFNFSRSSELSNGINCSVINFLISLIFSSDERDFISSSSPFLRLLLLL